MKKIIILIFLILGFGIHIRAQVLDITITNIQNKTGNIQLGFFKNADSFDEEKPYIKKVFPKNTVVNGQMNIKLNWESGVFGIALLDDEDKDGDMSYNFVGFPQEGFGFSNFYETGLKKPDFTKFCFYLNKETKKITIKVRYM
jgi:uncharacterized protein (DUF2141 family)